MVVVCGVATFSIGFGASGAAAGFRNRAIWRFAVWPHPEGGSHRSRVSSPIGVRYMNSCARLPPIIPTSDLTATTGRPQRLKILK